MNVAQPASVRILPMDRDKEFAEIRSTQELQRTFFLRELASRPRGEYWFRERGLNAPPGTVVLFQFGGQIVASATMTGTKRFKRAEGKYRGSYYFDWETIRIFEPVGADVVRRAWPSFSGFSRVRHILEPISKLATFTGFLKGVRRVTRADRVAGAAARVVRNGKKIFSRNDLRLELGLKPKEWNRSYDPNFQGMREHPGSAPIVGHDLKRIFRLIERGRHALTAHGRSVLMVGLRSDGQRNAAVTHAAAELDDEGFFSPDSLKEERERQSRSIAARQGQRKFRQKLFNAYGGRCAATSCNAAAALDAAHILPYTEPGSNHIGNGLLLRTDIHTLFDLNLIGVDPITNRIRLAPEIARSTYRKLNGQLLRKPRDPAHEPSREALERRWADFMKSPG